MTRLQELPHCENLELKFKQVHESPTVWPLNRAASLIPQSYTYWSVATEGVSTEDIETFLRSLPDDRTETNPLAVALMGKDEQYAEEANAMLHEYGSYPHVTIVCEA